MKNAQTMCCIYSLTLLLTACSGNNDDLNRYIKEVKNRKTQKLEPLPSFKPIPNYKFPDTGNRRSPFKPVKQQKEVDANAPDQNRPKQPLESFPLDALKFVGILKKENQTWALIKLPNSEIIPVHASDYMGKDYGQIVSIKNNEILLMETTQTLGKWQKHPVTIKLYTGK